MKNKLKFLAALTIMGVVAASCSFEDNLNPGPKSQGEKGFIHLTISSEEILTKGSVGEETATGSETMINGSSGLRVFVFNEDGSLDYSSGTTPLSLTETGPATGIFKSAPFEVTAGNKYFFVFANDAAPKITSPTPGMSMASFMAQPVVANGIDATLDIALNNNFLLGTLWREVKVAASGGTSTDPKTVSLNIGRLASKVNLSAVAYTTTNTDLLGTFSAAEYRIGSMPKNINTVGIHNGTPIPVGNDGVKVVSYAHYAPNTVSGGAFNATDYNQYSLFKPVNGTNMFYTTENTTEPDAAAADYLYYGNTTYIQIQTIYTPGAAEVFNPTTLAPATLVGATFWTANVVPNPSTPEALPFAGKRIVISGTGPLHIDIVAGSVLEYDGGKNYHKFAIFDPNESDDLLKYRVLRNHYYEFNVTNFRDLGSHTSDVEPTEPIPTVTTVDIEVQVLNWAKVSSPVVV